MTTVGKSILVRVFHLIYNRQPSWSPDGTWLAFSSNRSAHFGEWRRNVHDVFRVHLDGTDLQQLTTATYQESGAD